MIKTLTECICRDGKHHKDDYDVLELQHYHSDEQQNNCALPRRDRPIYVFEQTLTLRD